MGISANMDSMLTQTTGHRFEYMATSIEANIGVQRATRRVSRVQNDRWKAAKSVPAAGKVRNAVASLTNAPKYTSKKNNNACVTRVARYGL